MIGYPTKLTTSVQRSCHVGLSSYIKNDTVYLQPFISALHMIHKIICELCGRIGHKADACIICGPKVLTMKGVELINLSFKTCWEGF